MCSEPIILATQSSYYEDITVKAIAVDGNTRSAVAEYTYRVIPTGLNIAVYIVISWYTFNSSDTYTNDSYAVSPCISGSYSGQAISETNTKSA
jgi:hypothetical protein